MVAKLRCPLIASLILAICLHAPANAQSNCSTAQLRIEKFRAQNEGSTVTSIFGILINGCDIPTGPQIKVIFYDQAGVVLRVEDMWPASINNIPAKSEFPFQIRVSRVENFSRAEVRLVATKTW